MILPEFLSKISNKDVSTYLRASHLNDPVISKEYRYEDLLCAIYKITQRARYEQTMLKLSKALEGYDIYLPAYLDFRGRIYRSGILHFHERDLARSLLLFSDDNSTDSHEIMVRAMEANAFHFKSFFSISECKEWYNKKVVDDIFDQPYLDMLSNLIEMSAKAKRPFQFMSHTLCIMSYEFHYIPIVQDASASAYQIMSYFLLDVKIGISTNLISNREGKRKDIYTTFLEELLDFFDNEFTEPLLSIVKDLFTREVVKGIYMPLIYGKTLYSVYNDLKTLFNNKLTDKECLQITKACFKFWSNKYKGMECLIQLIRTIGWVVASRNSPIR